MPALVSGIRTSFVGRFARGYPIVAFVAFALAWTWSYGSLAIVALDTPVVIVEVGRIPAIWGRFSPPGP